jgi:hypothetical protein
MVGAGDIAVCGTNGDEETGTLVDSVVRADEASKIETVVFTIGDNAYPSGSAGVDEDFQRCFAKSWGHHRILDLIRPTLGNHDYDSGSDEAYFEYFGDRAGPWRRGYYSYDVGGWHVISLNSELYFEHGSRDEARDQEDWLRDDLEKHDAGCTLAYFHRPLFSSGLYGSTREVRTLWQILYDARADLILNGHEHHYERFRPQNPQGKSDPTNGIEEIIAGTGGGELRNLARRPAANSATRIQGRFGVLKLTLGDDRFRSEFIDSSGRVWDSSDGRCH